jgi:serine/threonine-protein kinase
LLPAGHLLDQSGGAHMIALSPDGTRMAYVATPFRLYLRLLSDLEMTAIPGAEKYVGVREPVFSPDGQWIAFYAFADATLKKIEISGGAVVTICKIDTPSGMNWGPDGIVFGQGAKGIWRVSPAVNSTPEPLARVAAGESAHGPQILPDRQHVLFTVATGGQRSRWDKAHIVVQSLASPDRKTLFIGSDARYIPTGHLLYAVSGHLFAVAFDAQRLETSGDPVEIVSGVNRAAGAVTGTADFSVSNTGSGSLVYVPGPVEAPTSAPMDLALLDRSSGKEPEPLGLAPGAYVQPRVSPDGTRIAFTNDDADGIVWIRDLRGTTEPRRLTTEGSNHFPIWTGDSKRIVFQSNRDGDLGIFWQAADGSDKATRLTTAAAGEAHVPESWSPKADVLLYSVAKGPETSLWMFSQRDGKTAPWGDVHSSTPTGAAFSPDGKWVAYTSTQKGMTTVYVQPFPANGDVHRLPAKGSDSPKHVRWSPDGRTLFDDPRPNSFESVSVVTQPTFAFGKTTALPRLLAMSAPSGRTTYDVLPDGRHIGMVTWGQKEYLRPPLDQIQVVFNWFDEIKRRVPSR